MWKDIPGWEGIYQVSDKGEVRSLTRTLRCRSPFGGFENRTFQGKALPGWSMVNGYRAVNLMRPGQKEKTFCVHTLVLLAFVGPRPEGKECCHNNGIRQDNRIANLRYDTKRGNALDRWEHGTLQHVSGANSPRAKLCATEVRWIRGITPALSYRRIGRILGVNHHTVRRAALRLTYKEVA
jgi:hypothetical protein